MKKVISKQYGIVLALVCVCTIAFPFAAFAEYEAVAHCVEEYGSSGECPGDDTWYSCCQGNTWAGIFEDWLNHYAQVEIWDDQAVDYRDWADHRDDELDPYGTDFADIALFVGHGTRKCNNPGHPDDEYWSTFVMGDDDGDCNVYLGKEPKNEIGFGDADLNVLLSRSCNGAQKCIWEDNQFNAIRDTNHFNVFNGFHGTHWAAWEDSRNFEAYLHWSKWEGMGSIWVTELTDRVVGGKNCAVSIRWGSNSADTTDLLYEAGHRDFHSSGSGHYAMAGISGCNPAEGETL